MLARFLWDTGSFNWLAQKTQIKDQIWGVQPDRSIRKVCSIRPQRIARHLLCRCQLSMTVRGCSEREQGDAQVNETTGSSRTMREADGVNFTKVQEN